MQLTWVCSLGEIHPAVRVYAHFSPHDISVEHLVQTWGSLHPTIKLQALGPALSCVFATVHTGGWFPGKARLLLFDRITQTHSSKLSSVAPSSRMLFYCVPALTDNPGKGEAQRVTLDFWVIWEVASIGNLKLFLENKRSGIG